MWVETLIYDFPAFKQGIDWKKTIEFSADGTVEDLSDWTAVLTIRSEPHSGGTLLLEITGTPNANGSSTTITGTTGLVSWHITDLDTDDFTWDVGYYDLKLTSPVADGAEKFVPLSGKISMLRNI